MLYFHRSCRHNVKSPKSRQSPVERNPKVNFWKDLSPFGITRLWETVYREQQTDNVKREIRCEKRHFYVFLFTIKRKVGSFTPFYYYIYCLDYSRVEANPPHPYIKVEAVAHEAVVNYCKWATTKTLL